jgi:tetratricopeptide (TPR) repeat protein
MIRRDFVTGAIALLAVVGLLWAPAIAQEAQAEKPPDYEDLLPPPERAPLVLDAQAEADLALLESQASAMPGDPELQIRVGIAYVRIGRYEEGLAALERALELAPGNLKFRYEYARGLFGAREYERVIEVATDLLERPGLDRELAAKTLVLSGSTRMRVRDMKGAEDDFREAIARDKTHAPAYLNLGVMLTALGRRAAGLTQVQRASVYAPHSVKIQSTLAQMLEKSLRTEEAHAAWGRVAELDPYDGDVQMKMAYYYLGDRNDEAARPYLEGAIRANPADGVAHYQLAELLVRQGEYDAATKHLETAQELGVSGQSLEARLDVIRVTGSDPVEDPTALDRYDKELEKEP